MILIVNNSKTNDNKFYKKMLKVVQDTGKKYIVVKNLAQLNNIGKQNITSIILSGSKLMVTNNDFTKYPLDFMMNIIAITRYDVPVLGICFGCQIINYIFGGTLSKLPKTLDEDIYVNVDNFRDKLRFSLNYVIKDLGKDMNVIATAKYKNNTFPCFIKHNDKSIYGCLFHPEAHTDTQKIIVTFCNTYN